MLTTFSIQTLGCRVNQYEAEQMAALLRGHGLRPADPHDPLPADLRIIHSCSVTVQAASKSRQLARRAGATVRRISLDQLPSPSSGGGLPRAAGECQWGDAGPRDVSRAGGSALAGIPDSSNQLPRRARVIVTGCWATSDPAAAASLPGVDAVVGHHQDVAAEIARLLLLWQGGEDTTVPHAAPTGIQTPNAGPRAAAEGAEADLAEHAPKPSGDNGWMMEVGAPAGTLNAPNKPSGPDDVNGNIPAKVPASGSAQPVRPGREASTVPPAGTTGLPVLGDRQSGRQRAYLKIQDGCDAHCTYCIIPRLRSTLWSKPVDVAVEEARRLVAAGHVELVLTGIFLGAYGQPTALRRRQPHAAGETTPLGDLVEALCTRVSGLRRLRLSSLEPGDLTADLLRVLGNHAQVVPHFHLPLQSGSDALLRRMNRQYTRADFLGMLDQVRTAFDRPALTTDVIVGFPRETDAEFEHTLEVVDAAGFIHVHAFSYSARPGTAAARWQRDFVRGPVVNDRIDALRARAAAHSLAFRQQFVGETVEVLVEREKQERAGNDDPPHDERHGRSERYFAVHFNDPTARPGDFARVRVECVTTDQTRGSLAVPAADWA